MAMGRVDARRSLELQFQFASAENHSATADGDPFAKVTAM
jgi:hypothetical protein